MSVSRLHKINHLSEFGAYRSFENTGANEIPDFKKRNLIYGWNYSGKTTLSRLFQSLEFPNRECPYEGASFSVSLDNGSRINQHDLEIEASVRVFNRDYVSRNFQQEHTAPAVFIVGEENVTLRNQLEQLQDARTRLDERVRARDEDIRAETNNLDTLLTESARSLRNLIGVNDFRKPDLDRVISAVRNENTPPLLNNDQIQAKVDTFRSSDQFARIDALEGDYPDRKQVINAIETLLGRTASHDAISELSDDRELEEWLRLGMPLHSETNQCRFCGNQLSSDRMEALRRHFSTAFMQLVREIDAKIGELRGLEINRINVDPIRFIQGVRDEASDSINNLNSAIERWGRLKEHLIERLLKKRSALETNLELELQVDDSELHDLEEAVNQVINRHNAQVEDLSTVKANARTNLERHFAADFIQRNTLFSREKQIKSLEKKKRMSQQASARLRIIADRIASQIDRTAIGADRFMELVSFLLRDSEIRVESYEETEFRILRGDAPADRMSEGEKTAIAFAYFVTALEADEEDVTQTIVYVDDPISSLDSNHVYAVFALIEERLSGAMQLFVSTHNSEFFNLLKAKWLNERAGRAYRRESEAFYIRKVTAEDASTSVIESLPPLLRKHGSEYEFIFAQLRAFSQAEAPSEYDAYCIPNLLRRFLEAYLGFRKPCTNAWHAKLDLITDSPELRREIHKLLDDASHLQRADRALQIPTFVTSARAAVRAVMEGLEAKDPVHYESLVTAVDRNNPQG